MSRSVRETSDLSTLSRSVNDGRARLGRALLGRSGASPWLFRCECGSPACDAEVELTLEAFERAPGLVLAEGHYVTRGQAARSEARRLVEEATALCAQAEQLVGRYGRSRAASH